MKKYVLGALAVLGLVVLLFPGALEAIYESTSRRIPYSFEGDADTGWGRSAANTISIYTSGVERTKIDSTATDVDTLSIGGTSVTSTAAELNIMDGVTATAIELNKTDGLAVTAYIAVTDGVSFTEDGSGTSYTATVEVPAGAVVHNICFTSTVLWDGTSASLQIGDDDDPNGWFEATDIKATALLVGEVLCAAEDGAWGGENGAYLTAAGRRGRVTAGVDSGWYYGAASEVIFLVTPGAADGSAGRSFGWVTYSVPTFTASTNA